MCISHLTDVWHAPDTALQLNSKHEQKQLGRWCLGHAHDVMRSSSAYVPALWGDFLQLVSHLLDTFAPINYIKALHLHQG